MHVFVNGMDPLLSPPCITLMSWFTQWFGTRYYALLYGHRDSDEAQPWASSILEKWNLKAGSDLLDMACGRGRHALWFAEHGMNVIGIDLSEQSIADARIAAPAVEFHVHDMRIPFATDRFDGAYCLFTSLGYSDSLEDDHKVFAGVMQALRPGGRFVLDFMNTHAVLRDLVPMEEVVRDGVHFKIERGLEEAILVKRITVTDSDQVHHYQERVQALMPEKLIEMAVAAGLVIDDLTDGPVPVPFDKDTSSRFVLWAHKPNA